uniref:Bucky ball n=1 Tax=Pundamilia nyererei TaxID=303518 RepID=A0A3B4H7T6_9CICH
MDGKGNASKQPQSFGSGQQRNHHPRPFFYVQPPSQPCYLYPQWQLNNPYSHFGLPGAFNFGRPCMHPYQYMQYPGFVLPHAPIYPMDYRRMFEPRFHAPVWGDVPRQQQHHYHPQPHGRRETACSEAQTDPSDAITKLIECLDKIRANELQGAERELDSGIASQSSGMFSPEEEKKNEEQARTLSTQGCWAGRLEEELPLDSSSVHEECPEEEVMDIQSDVSVTDQYVPRCDAEEPRNSTPASLAISSIQPSVQESKNRDHVSTVEHPAVSLDEAKADRSYQILKLPFDDVLTPGSAGPGHLCSPTAPYYYNYLSMQPKHERMSVLSPSLDELSSRDEMFSTDLDDVDLFPQHHMYAGRRLTEVIGGSPRAAEDVEEVWRPGTKRYVCACCGKSLAKGTGRSKVHSSKMYMDDAGDSEDEGRYGRGCEQPIRVVVRKHSSPRKTHPLPQRHPAKSSYKRGLYKEPTDAVDQDEERDGCKQEAGEGEAGEMDSGELQCRTCQGKSEPRTPPSVIFSDPFCSL